MTTISHGTTPFTLHVPYRLMVPESGGDGLPLIVALHGMGQTGTVMANRIAETLCGKERVLLFPDGPLPFEHPMKEGRREGRAWYIYTGDQAAFLESLRMTETHLLQLINQTLADTGADPTRVWLVGFSQGGYAAGVIILRNMARFQGMVSLSSRIKAEVLKDAPAPPNAPAFVAMHGIHDDSVLPDAAEESVKQLQSLGFSASFETFDAQHRINGAMLERLNEILPGGPH